MTSVLDKALKNKQPIVITGWVPHWMFTKYDLKILDDPKKFMVKAKGSTIARLGLKKINLVLSILENFNWTSDQLAQVMLQINDGGDPAKAAKNYLKKHPEQLNTWLKTSLKVKVKL